MTTILKTLYATGNFVELRFDERSNPNIIALGEIQVYSPKLLRRTFAVRTFITRFSLLIDPKNDYAADVGRLGGLFHACDGVFATRGFCTHSQIRRCS